MSKRNSQAAKTAARERLRVEREKQAKKEKAKRKLIVAVSVVGALAVAAGAGFLIMESNKPEYWEQAAKDKLVKPANTSGENGTTVVIGKDSAKKTLKLYEDPRCPACASFEQSVGPTIKKDLADGKYKVQFIGAAFLDKSLLGEGSRNALSALGAALNVSPGAFMDFKEQLYSAKYHPQESKDDFKKDSYLIEVADQVKELKGNEEFRKAVEDGTYDRWALELAKTFNTTKDDVKGTPTVYLDDKKITAQGSDSAPGTPEEFNRAVDAALKG
ncbi:thioredoxin domain-containing protein [Streptomyces sp. LE64]|uniref:thioredoxin domain-containing protein n=1 Tax=Streptomyces sp. LE64 TaxID=3448653 RepID=UPI004043437B